jgi:hypothetical protein
MSEKKIQEPDEGDGFFLVRLARVMLLLIFLAAVVLPFVGGWLHGEVYPNDSLWVSGLWVLKYESFVLCLLLVLFVIFYLFGGNRGIELILGEGDYFSWLGGIIGAVPTIYLISALFFGPVVHYFR